MADLAQLASATLTSFLVLILARAAWHKGQSYLQTVGFAQGYGLVPASWTPAIVRGLMIAEALVVLALVLPVTRSFGGLAAAGLFLGYGVLMVLALGRGQTEIDCGCGGAPQIVSAITVGRNLLLTALALAVALVPPASIGPAGAALAVTAGVTFFAIYGVAEKLASHLPHIRHAG